MEDNRENRPKRRKIDPRKKRALERKRIRQRNTRFAIFVGSILLIALIVFAVNFVKQGKVIKDYEAKNAEKDTQIQELQEEIDKISDDLQQVNSDEFIEKYAREKLGMIKEDELIVVDPEKGEVTNTEDQTDDNSDNDDSTDDNSDSDDSTDENSGADE